MLSYVEYGLQLACHTNHLPNQLVLSSGIDVFDGTQPHILEDFGKVRIYWVEKSSKGSRICWISADFRQNQVLVRASESSWGHCKCSRWFLGLLQVSTALLTSSSGKSRWVCRIFGIFGFWGDRLPRPRAAQRELRDATCRSWAWDMIKKINISKNIGKIEIF